MEQDNSSRPSGHGTLLAVKSWTAYLNTLLLAVLLFGFALPLSFRYSEWLAGAVMLVAILVVGYRILLIRSVQLYYDDVGVWLYSGILPWAKGVQGVKWRDMDEAVFVPSFWSWLFRSYSIRIGHRFTKSSEILLTRMGNGKAAVERLNAHHQELIRNNVIS